MEESNQLWYQQLAKHIENSGKPVAQVAREIGIGGTTLRDYTKGKLEDLNKMSDQNKQKLYQLTGLDIFKVEGLENRESDEGNIGRIVKHAYDIDKGALNSSLDALVNKMGGREKFEAGLLKVQRYQPNVSERVNGIMELLDVLAEEVDYFRSAPDNEKKSLTERIQKSPESFSYVTQILNILYSGKNLNSWMLHSQPPSRIRKLGEKGNEI